MISLRKCLLKKILFYLFGIVIFFLFYSKRKTELLNEFRQRRYENYQMKPFRSGPGENGSAVILTSEEQELADKLYENATFNIIAANKVALDRSLPESRRKECFDIVYPVDLPTMSVVMISYNEAVPSILRTITSVVNRTPPEYLQEIIFVDDHSSHEDVYDKLEHDIDILWPDGIVKIIRHKVRQGLMRARVTGAKAATGDVLVIMDAHMEVTTGWYQPILSRLKEKPNTLVVPVIDWMKEDNLEYVISDDHLVCGFYWDMYFRWMYPSTTELKRRKKVTDPIRSPAIVGCIFAIKKDYFFHIGAFDEGMKIWGAENVELPLRIFMCGGTVELLPCSRVGHLYRRNHYFSLSDQSYIVHHNGKRTVEVWLDDYKRLFYYGRENIKSLDVGDLTERKKLRQELKCSSFKDFLHTYYPEMFVFDENVFSYGQVKNNFTSLCLDSLGHGRNGNVCLYSCDKNSWNQIISFTKTFTLVLKEFCLVPSTQNNKLVSMKPCKSDDEYFIWKHNKIDGQIKHLDTGLCLDSYGLKVNDDIQLSKCNLQPSQRWKFQFYESYS